MFRNYLAAALRNLMRNGAYAAINVLGLALGFAAVILIALFVRDEYSYDRFFPDHARTYLVTETVNLPGEAPLRIATTASNIALAMKLDFPEVETVTRLAGTHLAVRRGETTQLQWLYCADANFFNIFPLQVIAGNPDEALSRPDGVVLTSTAARRYFGREDVVGEVLEVDRQYPLRVGAVIGDMPTNTHLDAEFFASAAAGFSPLSRGDDARPDQIRPETSYTYVRLRPGAQLARVASAMGEFVLRHVTGEVGGLRVATAYKFNLVPIAGIHLQPTSIADMKPPSDPRTLQTLAGIAVLILTVAASNFVSMMTARATGRAIEVGVRKAEGATRGQIIAQFLGECLFYTALALALAVVAVELILPALNSFLDRGIVFDYVHDPMLAGGIVAVWLLTALAAGAYAALVLSAFRPGAVLKGAVALPGGSGRLRQVLVVFQFGTLIALIVSTLTIQRQTQYAMQDRLRLPTDEIYFGGMGCPAAFRDAVTRIQGVRAAVCSSGEALGYGRSSLVFEAPNGTQVAVKAAPVDYGFFELFGIRPLAGRLLAQNRGEDDLLRADPNSRLNPAVLINETAARALGYTAPGAAVNQYRLWRRVVAAGSSGQFAAAQSSQIIGVVADFPISSAREVIEPTVYYIDPARVSFPVLKLDGRAIPETMAGVKALWAKVDGTPFEGLFLSQRVNELYADVQRQSAIFSAFSAVAVIIAALGLLGLAVFTAERRTREIGLRKVMGASRWDILRFLGWQFARPVLWANLIAWPLAYFCMQRWLAGFAYHIDQSPLLFFGASALALLIALATVSGHALLVARTKPAQALRYE